MITMTEAVCCCFRDCSTKNLPQEEGLSWIIAKDKEGNKVRVPACKKHAGMAYSVKCRIEEGEIPDYVIPELLSYPGKDDQRKKERDASIRHANKDWEWVDEMDRWRLPEGNVLKISRMTDADVYDAVLAIAGVLEEKPRGFKWLEKVHGCGLSHYPAELLCVAIEDSIAKLDEFKEELVQRGKLKL